MRALLIPVVAVAAYFVVPFRGERWPLAVAFGLATTVAVLPLAYRRIRRIQVSDSPMVDALEALSMLVTLVIVGFATSHYAVATNTDQFPALDTKLDALYFTVVTLGTVGYGDLAPQGQGARALVTVQILVNLTLIGGSLRLVGAAAREAAARRLAVGERPDAPPGPGGSAPH